MKSVAIATYNGEKYIIEQLESIRNQYEKVDEVIIQDDCSRDNTVNLVKKYIEKNHLYTWKLFVNKQNMGYCLNFFSAIKKCQGEFIFLCDQDDVWYPQKVGVMIECMEKNPKILALASSYDLCDGTGKLIANPGLTNVRSKSDGNVEFINFSSLMGASYIRGCTMCIRKSLMENEKEFDLGASLGHDWLLNIYACIKGKAAFINIRLSKYRVHENNISFKTGMKFSKKTTLERRLKGLEQQKKVLLFLLHDRRLKKSEKQNIKNQIKFVTNRTELLQKFNIILWIKLGKYLNSYRREYRTWKGAIRIYVGDLLYSRK